MACAARCWYGQLGLRQEHSALRGIVGSDPLPYGLAANLKTIEALVQIAYKQGLTPKRMSMESLFVDPEKS
jgi:4,5-dihydroxyphthalate decarboxylase